MRAVNAKTDAQAFAAFREGRRDDEDRLGASLKNEQLAVMLNELRRKHPLIADDLGTDAGIDLMNLDGKITEHVIRRLMEEGIPVLTVHDSYIVHFAFADMLQEVLAEAYELMTGQTGIRSESTGVEMGDEQSWLTQKLPPESMIRSRGYRDRMIDWMAYKDR